MAFGAFRLPEKSQKNLEIQENIIISSAEEESNKLIKKDSEEPKPVEESNYKKVCFFVKKPEIYRPIIFIFLFMITPSAGSSMFFFYTNELKFHPDFMGQLKLIHSLANMIGIFIYHRFLKLIPFKKLFAYSTMICTITGLTQILLVTRFFFIKIN